MTKNASKLDSSKVLEWARGRKGFTTKQVASRFKVSTGQAAAGIAILRIKEVVAPAEPPKTKAGVSRWDFVG